MFARRNNLWCKRMAVWQGLLCLTVIAFLCRAIIPAGYMPEQRGDAGHVFAMTLCLGGGGTAVMLTDLSGDDGGPEESRAQAECPYGFWSGYKSLPGHPALMLVGIAHLLSVVPTFTRSHALPPLPALGPPLGSRAPPLNLG